MAWRTWIGVACLTVSASVAAAADTRPAVKVLCSFELEEMQRLYPNCVTAAVPDGTSFRRREAARPDFQIVTKFATDGRYAFPCTPPNYRPTSQLIQMRTYVFGMNYIARLKAGDWRGYDSVWVDVTVPEREAALRMLFEDDAVCSPFFRYRVPKGQTVTLALPIAQAVQSAKEHGEGDLNPADVRSIYLWIEDSGGTPVYADNLRLATKAAPRPANLVEPFQVLPLDFGWKEEVKKIAPLPKRDFPRETGPVAPLGPITLPRIDYGKQAAPFGGAFGEGGDYGAPVVRGVAAYDNRRILLVLGNLSHLCATFDGGPTSGGIDGKPGVTTRPGTGHTGTGASGISGDAFLMTRHSLTTRTDADGRISWGNWTDYRCHGGGNIGCIAMYLLVFRGDRWEPGPAVLLDHHIRHCPGAPGAMFLQLKSGRVWGFWHSDSNVQGGLHIIGKYSDDGGVAWRFPGRYASITGLRGLQYESFLALPYKEHVAVVWGGSWSAFDGQKFTDPQVIDPAGKMVSAAAAPDGTVCVAMVPLKGPAQSLTVKRLAGAEWKSDVLDDGAGGTIGPVSMTASGSRVFCFWIREAAGADKSYALLYSRWTSDRGWDKPVEIARETEPVHRIVTPEVSPADYVPVFWDKRIKNPQEWRTDYPWVRFARVPADAPWKPR